MGIGERLSLGGRLDRYEQVTVVGILLTVLGSFMSWITVQASQQAATQLDDIQAGTTAFTGMDVGWGVFTLILAVAAAVVLALVLWRYHGPGRITGLFVMLVGLIAAGVAVVGIVLTGVLFSPAGEFEGVSVDLGAGILVTLLGALGMLSGGILRLAAGAVPADEAAAE